MRSSKFFVALIILGFHAIARSVTYDCIVQDQTIINTAGVTWLEDDAELLQHPDWKTSLFTIWSFDKRIKNRQEHPSRIKIKAATYRLTSQYLSSDSKVEPSIRLARHKVSLIFHSFT